VDTVFLPPHPSHQPVQTEETMLNHRRIIYLLAFADGIALLVLVFLAVPVKYMLDMPIGVKILGPLHGALFTSLMLASVTAVARGLLKPGMAALLFIGALFPFGAFYADRRLKLAYPELDQ
jgi:integral membrane protein